MLRSFTLASVLMVSCHAAQTPPAPTTIVDDLSESMLVLEGGQGTFVVSYGAWKIRTRTRLGWRVFFGRFNTEFPPGLEGTTEFGDVRKGLSPKEILATYRALGRDSLRLTRARALRRQVDSSRPP